MGTLTADGDDIIPEGEGVVLVEEAVIQAALAEVGGRIRGTGCPNTGVQEDLAVVGNGLEEDGGEGATRRSEEISTIPGSRIGR